MFWWLDKQLREIRGTDHYTIAALPEVTIGRSVGIAKPLDGKTVDAALSGRPCLAFMAKAVAPTSNYQFGIALAKRSAVCHSSSRAWRSSIRPGRAPRSVSRRSRGEVEAKSTLWPGPLQRQQEFLERSRIRTRSSSVECYERIVSVGEKIAVVGLGHRVDGQLRMSSSPHLPLVIFDNLATLKT
ncbi:MAG: hypothetical protein ABI704_30235 [Kofleriaceae bacterium]